MSTKPTKPPARTWHKGPPPHVGWWNASTSRARNLWRWWDGAEWSTYVFSASTAVAARRAAATTRGYNGIEWTDYYPADARVPRLDPAEGWLLNTGKRPEHPGRIEVAFFDGKRCDTFEAATWLWFLPGEARLLGGGHIYAWRPAP